MSYCEILDCVEIVNDCVKPYQGYRNYLDTGGLKISQIEEVRKYDFDSKPSRANQNVQAGDIILARMKGTVKVKVISVEESDFMISTGFLVLRVKENFSDINYLYHIFLSDSFQRDKDELCTGATQKAINNENFKKLRVSLPPRDEQKKIASILDAADAYRQKTKALIKKYDELIQSLFTNMFGNIVSNELKWNKSKVGDVSASRLGKMLDKKQQTGKMLKPYIKNTNVKWFHFDLEDLPEMDFNEKDKIEFALRQGDIMVCEGGEVGRAAIWGNNHPECYFQKALHRVRVNKEVLNEYYFVYWLKEMAKLNGLKDYVSSVTIPHLTGAKLKSIDITLPPVNLQNQFANNFQAIEAQKTQAQNSLAHAEDLFNSLLQKVLKGELVKD